MTSETTINLPQLLLLCCIAPTILMVVLSIVLLRQGQKFLTPNVSQLQGRFERMKQQEPGANREVFIRKVIQRQSINAGIIGALTSVGGVWLLPAELLADLYLSARNQSATMQFLAWAYGIDDAHRTLKLGEVLALRGLDRAQITPERLMMWQDQFAGRVYRELIGIVMQKSFAKLIPFAGLLIGFAVNYFSARLFATLASQYYSGNLARLGGQVRNAVVAGGDKAFAYAAERLHLTPEELQERIKTISSQLGPLGTQSAEVARALAEVGYNPKDPPAKQFEALMALREQGVINDTLLQNAREALKLGVGALPASVISGAKSMAASAADAAIQFGAKRFNISPDEMLQRVKATTDLLAPLGAQGLTIAKALSDLGYNPKDSAAKQWEVYKALRAQGTISDEMLENVKRLLGLKGEPPTP